MMTFLQPPMSLRRTLARDEPTSMSQNKPITRTDQPVPAEPDAPAKSMIPPRLYVFAGLSGAAAAAVAVMLLSALPLRAHDDPRLAQVLHDTEDLSTHVQDLTDKVRTLETESVATGQTTDTLDGRLKSSTTEVDAIRATLAALVAEQQRSAGAIGFVNAPALFGVAVVQLRDRVDSGLPFEWEVVNLRGIVASNPPLVAELDRLVPMARFGVVTQDRLSSAMRGLVARDSSSASYVQAGLSAVSRALGSTLVGPPTNDAQTLLRAQARLAVGDLLNFVREMQALSPTTVEAARPLVDAAKQRIVATQAVMALARAGRTGLQSQLRSAIEATTLVAR
jgi:hypothetical protein